MFLCVPDTRNTVNFVDHNVGAFCCVLYSPMLFVYNSVSVAQLVSASVEGSGDNKFKST